MTCLCYQAAFKKAFELCHACLQSQEMQCPVRVVIILDTSSAVDELTSSNNSESEVMREVSGCWPQLSGIDDSGAVLVRPDSHVLWRCNDAEHPMLRLRCAMQKCMYK